MTYLLDSDWTADYLAGHRRAVRMLSTLSRSPVAISIITYGEIYEGIYFGRDQEATNAGFEAFLQWVDVLPLTTEIMKVFARIRGDLRRSGRLLDTADLLIAATALHHELTLVSRNIRHFERIPGLNVLPAIRP